MTRRTLPPPAIDARPRRAPALSPVYEETLRDNQFATTLARGLEVLRCFTPQTPALGNRELVQGTGLPKATVSRFTYTLCRLGYLRHDAHTGKYQLGTAVVSLGYPLLASMRLRPLARPGMNALAEQIGGSVSMGVRDRLNIVYVETSRSRALTAPQYSDVGLTHPIIATSIGRAWLAACAPRERKGVLNEIRVKEAALYARYGEAALRSIEDFPRLGFCLCYDYFLPDVYGAAVPLKQRVGGEIVVFNCVVSAARTSRAQMQKEIGPRLAEMADRLEQAALQE